MSLAFLSYDVLRALHIISVVAWMAGLLMLPRLYAYQTGATPGGELDQTMIAASRRLRAIIITPAMILTWAFGVWLILAYRTAAMTELWLIAKLALVTALSGLHGYFVSMGRKLERGQRPLSEKTWRLLNEVPFLIAIAVILLAVIEPR
jgi:putative membrane protein